MIDSSSDTKDRVVKEDKLLLQTLTAVSRLDSDISQMYSPLYSYSKANPTTDPTAVYQDNVSSNGSFDGKAQNGMVIPQFQSPDKSSLIFFTSANRRKVADAKESRYNWVKYSLRRTQKDSEDASDDKNLNDKGDQELIRQTISSNIYVSELNWSDAKAQVLLTQVKSVEFNFWDERAKKFVGSVQDLNENKNLIRSIKMALVWVDENNHEQKIEKIFRIVNPYFNTKLDDVKLGGAYGGGSPPPGVSDPSNPQGGQGGADVHY